MPWENGCAVPNHRYHICCMELWRREVLIGQVIQGFGMHMVMAKARSTVFEANLTRLNSVEETRCRRCFSSGKPHTQSITTPEPLCQSYLFLLQPFFAKRLSKLSQFLNKLVQRMFGGHVRPERFSVTRIRATIKALLRAVIYNWNPVPHDHKRQFVLECRGAWVQIEKSWVVMVIHEAAQNRSDSKYSK